MFNIPNGKNPAKSKSSNSSNISKSSKNHEQDPSILDSLYNISKNTDVDFEEPLILNNGIAVYPIKEFSSIEEYRTNGHRDLRSKNNIKQVIIHYTENDIQETVNIFTMDKYIIRLLNNDTDVLNYLSPLNKGKEILIVNYPKQQQIKVFYREIKVKGFGSKNQIGGNFFLLDYNVRLIEQDLNAPTIFDIISGLKFNNDTVLNQLEHSLLYNFIGDQVKGIGNAVKLKCSGFAASQVSCHYVITENEPKSNILGGIIIQVVKEEYIAGHAGVSSWMGDQDLNLSSIGIELVNKGHNGHGWNEHDYYSRHTKWNKFDYKQIVSLGLLCQELMKKYNIAPQNFIGHEDIAPNRKQDPGPLFPWGQLFEGFGVGAWLTEDELNKGKQEFFKEHPEYSNNLHYILSPEDNELFFMELQSYGYEINNNRKQVLRAFKSHFSCNNNLAQFTQTKKATVNDWIWARGLVQKYFPCKIK